MKYTFLSFHVYPTKYDSFTLEESTSFKPVFHILDTVFDNMEIYVDSELVWRVSKYGSICYVIRYFNGNIFSRYTLSHGKIKGYVYIYGKEYLKYILQYNNNNLHGKQFILDGTTIQAVHGKVDDRNIYDIHKIACDLLKWV